MTEGLTSAPEPMTTAALNVDFFRATTDYLLPIALICGICVLATAVWAVVVSTYTRSPKRHF